MEQKLGIKESIKSAWQNRPFVFGLVMFLFNGVTMKHHPGDPALLCEVRAVVEPRSCRATSL